MRSVSKLANWKAGLIMQLAVICLSVLLFEETNAQCVYHPDKKTALKFSNESRFELTFFVDDDEEEGVVVTPKSVSREVRVEPGEHLLRARAIVRGESFWVWVINDVPQDQICTWTVEDPPREGAAVNNRKSEKDKKKKFSISKQTKVKERNK